jgi:hypothetical protein
MVGISALYKVMKKYKGIVLENAMSIRCSALLQSNRIAFGKLLLETCTTCVAWNE